LFGGNKDLQVVSSSYLFNLESNPF